MIVIIMMYFDTCLSPYVNPQPPTHTHSGFFSLSRGAATRACTHLKMSHRPFSTE